MTLPTNYSELKAEVANWLNRSDLTSDIPTFIAFAEARLNRVSRLVDQEVIAEILTTPNQNYSDLPVGFLQGISLIYSQNLYVNPVKIDIAILDEYKVLYPNASGIPAFYAISNGKIYWDIAPSQVFSLQFRYWKKWDIATDGENALLTAYPDVYLYPSLSQAASFIKDPAKADWEAMATDAINQVEYWSSKQKKAALITELNNIANKRYNIFIDY